MDEDVASGWKKMWPLVGRRCGLWVEEDCCLWVDEDVASRWMKMWPLDG
jgi:hypothetical protein